MFGTTTNSLFKNFSWAQRAILSFSYVPLTLITVAGLAVTVLAFVGAAAQLVLRFVRPELAPAGITTVLLVVLFLGGVQLLSLSVIGGYLGHIYDEVKRRPPYIVDSILNDPSSSEQAPDEP
jgi:polyisoprenyl-phosphate glycosyltransferase